VTPPNVCLGCGTFTAATSCPCGGEVGHRPLMGGDPLRDLGEVIDAAGGTVRLAFPSGGGPPRPCTCQNGPCDGECGYSPKAWEEWERKQEGPRDWRCPACGTLLGVVQDGVLTVAYKAALYRIRGTARTNCRRCGTLSEASSEGSR
jgi:hypothetical protein